MVKNIDITKTLTEEQIKMLENAKKLPVYEDDDCPSFTKEELLQFKRISAEKRMSRQKQAVTLRLSQKTLNKAKSLGKGYTSILSRILESALEDPEIVKHYL